MPRWRLARVRVTILSSWDNTPSACADIMASGFLAVVGSFTADGTGNITAGEADTNGVLGAQTGNLITSASSYSVGPDNRGCATLATPFGTFYTRFALGGVSAGVATQGRIIEFDNPGASAYIAAGQILQQTRSAFLLPITGSYAFADVGLGSVHFRPRRLRRDCDRHRQSNSVTLQQDCNDNGTVTNTTNTSTTTNTPVNTYTTADTNGRGTGIISVGREPPRLTFYWVSTDATLYGQLRSQPHLQRGLAAGECAARQSSGSIKLPSMATWPIYSSGLPIRGGGDVSIATETADGTVPSRPSFTGMWRAPGNPARATCTYTVVSIGRITLGGSNCGANPPIPYLITLNTAFVLGTDSTVELGSFEPADGEPHQRLRGRDLLRGHFGSGQPRCAGGGGQS